LRPWFALFLRALFLRFAVFLDIEKATLVVRV
jgi:hypothetical protein